MSAWAWRPPIRIGVPPARTSSRPSSRIVSELVPCIACPPGTAISARPKFPPGAGRCRQPVAVSPQEPGDRRPRDGQPLVRPRRRVPPKDSADAGDRSSRTRPSGERSDDSAGVGQPTGRADESTGSSARPRRLHSATVPDAVIAFDFDPLLQLGDGVVRWETIGVAVAIFAALVIAGAIARRMGLRGDDLLFVVLGVVPGAVIGGRLGYVLLHPAFFGADPSRIVDPSVGSLELTLGVVGGALTGALVARAARRPARPLAPRRDARRCSSSSALGKLAMVLGGSGQGQPTSGDAGDGLSRPGAVGLARPGDPLDPVAGARRRRDRARAAPDGRSCSRRSCRRADGRVVPGRACRVGGRAAS